MTDATCPEVIATERLVLQPWSFEDLADVLSYATDEEWAAFLPVPRPYTNVDARRFIAAQVVLDRGDHPTWSIRYDVRAIGGCNIRFSNDHHIGEIGYSVARPWWGHGFATEAARAMIDAAFQTYPHLARVRAMADARNIRSQRVLEKLGMRQEGLLRRNRLVHDALIDETWFGVLRDEWTATGRGR